MYQNASLPKLEAILKDSSSQHEFTVSFNELTEIRNELKRLYIIEEKYRLLVSQKPQAP